MNWKFAKRMDALKASEIREILKVTENPEMISFAGGLPAPELFPIGEILEACRITLETHGEKALQYTTTEGYPPLRQWIADRMNQRLGTAFRAENILITRFPAGAGPFRKSLFGRGGRRSMRKPDLSCGLEHIPGIRLQICRDSHRRRGNASRRAGKSACFYTAGKADLRHSRFPKPNRENMEPFAQKTPGRTGRTIQRSGRRGQSIRRTSV